MSKLEALLSYMEAAQARLRIDEELRQTPARKEYNRLVKTMKEQQAAVQKLTDEMASRAAAIKKIADRTAEAEKKISLDQEDLTIMQGDEETTAEEMTELRGDIEKLNREISQLSKDANSLAQAIETAVQEYRNLIAEYNKNRKAYETAKQTCEQEKADAAKRIAEADAEAERRRKQVDPALIAQYDRSAKHNTMNAVVAVRGNQCSGCNMQLPSATLKELRGGATVECENCGRVLYILAE